MNPSPRCAFAVCCFSFLPGLAHAVSIDASDIYSFRVASGPNTAGFSSNDNLTFGVFASPNGFGEDNGVPVLDANGDPAPPTTGTASQNGTVRQLNFEGDPSNPNLYSGGIQYDPNLTGAWTLNLENGADTLILETPEVGDTRLPARVNDVGLTVGSDKTTPTITWNNVDTDPDAVRLTVYDLEQRDLAGQAVQVFSSPRFRNGETSYTIPDGELEEDRLYAIRIETRIERDEGISSTGDDLTGSTLSVNRTWFNFATSDLPEGIEIKLPEVILTESGTPVFVFDNEVTGGEVEFYDPIVAVGYDYQIGEDNPLFASVLLPDIGDGVFDLLLPNFSGGFDLVAEINAGIEYSFGDGVEMFRILGIETSAGLDPEDPTAFVSGLSFKEDGRFTGTMTPISQEIAPVPLPAGMPLLLGGLLAFRFIRRRC